MEVMLHVPVPPPKDLTFVDKAVRETRLKTLIATPEAPPAGSAMEGQQADGSTKGQTEGKMEAPSGQDLKRHVKKRRLYRQATDTEESGFPHDNAKELLKELVWEAGGDQQVKWVCHGSPAAGNGVVGLLELGCNVRR